MRDGATTTARPIESIPGSMPGSMTIESIGALLARVRGEQGITQLRLAARLCAAASSATVTRHEISRWEREERIPSGYWLSWLAVVLDHPLEALERAAGVARRRRHDGPRRGPAVPAIWEECQPGVYRRAS
jgi:transcriptional regulator with XRE-family HTH domain